MVIATTSAAAVTTAEVMNDGPADPLRTLATLTLMAGDFGVTITKDAVAARQMVIDPFAWPMAGPTTFTGRPVNAPRPSLVRWADALITD